nr:uncharacterized protein LOC127310089 [Lolium perenne]
MAVLSAIAIVSPTPPSPHSSFPFPTSAHLLPSGGWPHLLPPVAGCVPAPPPLVWQHRFSIQILTPPSKKSSPSPCPPFFLSPSPGSYPSHRCKTTPASQSAGINQGGVRVGEREGGGREHGCGGGAATGEVGWRPPSSSIRHSYDVPARHPFPHTTARTNYPAKSAAHPRSVRQKNPGPKTPLHTSLAIPLLCSQPRWRLPLHPHHHLFLDIAAGKQQLDKWRYSGDLIWVTVHCAG